MQVQQNLLWKTFALSRRCTGPWVGQAIFFGKEKPRLDSHCPVSQGHGVTHGISRGHSSWSGLPQLFQTVWRPWGHRPAITSQWTTILGLRWWWSPWKPPRFPGLSESTPGHATYLDSQWECIQGHWDHVPGSRGHWANDDCWIINTLKAIWNLCIGEFRLFDLANELYSGLQAQQLKTELKKTDIHGAIPGKTVEFEALSYICTIFYIFTCFDIIFHVIKLCILYLLKTLVFAVIFEWHKHGEISSGQQCL